MSSNPDAAKSNVGDRLRALRRLRGMSLIAMAKALGLSRNELEQLEQGHRVPKQPTLEKIQRALGVDLQTSEHTATAIDSPRNPS